MDTTSGVGVLDKAALVLTALESGPATLAGLVASTGLARPTAHRLAVALEHHRLVAREREKTAVAPAKPNNAAGHSTGALILAWLSGFSVGALALLVAGILISRLSG